jgi:dTDP-4-dehydrorhamnose reductase
MKVIIFGHRGWIGSMMCELLKQDSTIELITTNFRANDIRDVELLLEAKEPTHVMSFIGRTHGTIDNKKYTTIDYLEQEGKLTENVRDNLFSPLVLATLCAKYNIHFTYLGTGCIFKYDDEHKFGDEQTGFLETDEPNFTDSSYSTVKGYTDQLMSLYEETVLNLRIRMPITSRHEPRNFITKITSYEYICSIPNSMTVLDELLPYALDMARRKLTGTYNFTNPGVISHNEILEMYKQYVDNTFTWKNFTQKEQDKILAAGRSNNCLDTRKLERLYPVKHIRDSIRDVLTNFRV